jgi:hypothetical protein
MKNLDFINVKDHYHLYIWTVYLFAATANYKDAQEFAHL